MAKITSERDHVKALNIIDTLLDVADVLTKIQLQRLEELGDAVEAWEAELCDPGHLHDCDLVAHLLEASGKSQSVVCRETGINPATMSLILSGKRQLTRRHIAQLSKVFHVSPATFFL